MKCLQRTNISRLHPSVYECRCYSTFCATLLIFSSREYYYSPDDVTKWNHYPRHGPFVRGTVRVNSPHKGQWRGALVFSLICAWTHGWINNRKSGELRRHRAHYDATLKNAHITFYFFSVDVNFVYWHCVFKMRRHSLRYQIQREHINVGISSLIGVFSNVSH